MGRRKKPRLENVLISDIGAEGKAIAKVEDQVVFVTGGVVPGDVVDVQIKKKRKNYMEGYPLQIKTYSQDRVDAFCEYFGTCGGCKWQSLPYDKQLYFKQKQVEDQLTRIGQLDLPEIQEILASKQDRFYRNKLEFTFSNQRWITEEEVAQNKEFEHRNGVGFHVSGKFDRIVDINYCYLQRDPSNDIRNFFRDYALGKGLSFYDPYEHKGLFRNIIIRLSTSGEIMLIVVFGENKQVEIEQCMNTVHEKFPEITSLMYVVNTKLNDTIFDLKLHLFKGKDYIIEEMEDLKFKVGPKSFYQTNSLQAYELYKIAREYAGLSGKEIVYDLYTGTGTIANFVAGKAKKVVGIEYIPEAIEDAKENSRINKIENTSFYAGDMKDVLTPDLFQKEGIPDVIILDPPRAGVHINVVNAILLAKPQKIVYVSCNPATQARDLQLLDQNYSIEKVQPVDMFPHTHHVENIVLLSKK